MNILTISGNDHAIKFKIFRYSQKGNTTVLAEGCINDIHTKDAKLLIANLLNKKTVHENIKLSSSNYDEILKNLTNNDKFNLYNFDVIINHIPYGGDEYSNIVLLHSNTLKSLAKYNQLATNLPSFSSQPQSLLIAKYFMQLLPKIKHYACFDTTFHHQLVLKSIKAGDINHYSSSGLAFQYLSGRLYATVDGKIAKKYWAIVYWNSDTISIGSIKNGKAATATFEFSMTDTTSKPPIKHTQEYVCAEVAGQIVRVATLSGGLNGIIFSGDIGANDSKVRAKVVETLEWLGIGVSKKANNANKLKIHKKESTAKILVIKADEEQAMIDQFVWRNA
jgi:acetate kinase